MKYLQDKSIDFLFTEFPRIDIMLFWKEVYRVCNDDSVIFITCSTKNGIDLINSNLKNFRYDLVWYDYEHADSMLNEDNPQRPVVAHKMIYVFYSKLPKIYNDKLTEYHTRKFIKHKERTQDTIYGPKTLCAGGGYAQYDPPLPTTIIKTNIISWCLKYFCKYNGLAYIDDRNYEMDCTQWNGNYRRTYENWLIKNKLNS